MTAKKKYYFDYASTTPLDPRVFAAMKPYFIKEFGNPANLYGLGRVSKNVINRALQKITTILNCSPQEFVFTGSATESDNLALLGVARANKDSGNRIIVSSIEHKGILVACDALAKEGFEIIKLGVGQDGLINPQSLSELLDQKTILVSITYADNETGTIQPVEELVRVVRNFRQKHNHSLPYIHTDATQASAYLNLDVKKLGVDLMTLSGHKIYGPKGIGGLFVRKGIKIQPIIWGGGQQDGLRSGTENLPGIVGFAKALALVQKEKKIEYRRLKKLRDKLEKGILNLIPRVVLNGHPEKRLPNFLNVSILDIEGEAILLYLDESGIYVNTGSACNSRSLEPSYVLMAMGRPYEYIHGSLRFSLGKFTKVRAIDYVLKHLPPIVEKLRRVSPLKLKIGAGGRVSQPKAFVGGQTPHFLRYRD